MKLLTLIRHAKSDWNHDVSDFERKLNNRGLADASKIGECLFSKHLNPDLIISSSAKRARKTAKIIAEKIGYDLDKLVSIDELYLCGISEYINVLSCQNENINHIILVSHNPGTTSFASLLLNQRIEEVPTCGVVSIELQIAKWKDIEPYVGVLKDYFTPKTI